jgi:hypothetical protein
MGSGKKAVFDIGLGLGTRTGTGTGWDRKILVLGPRLGLDGTGKYRSCDRDWDWMGPENIGLGTGTGKMLISI